nr:hypothetical protein [Tanacetum cinerariifolium]
MRIDELHKFNDGTLNDVRTALDDRLKGIRMKYLPQAIWRKSDKKKVAAMIQSIDKQLKTRRIMRSLKKFVGERLYYSLGKKFELIDEKTIRGWMKEQQDRAEKMAQQQQQQAAAFQAQFEALKAQLNELITDWERFKESVMDRFGTSKYEDPQGASSNCYNSVPLRSTKWVRGHKCSGKFLLLMADDEDDTVQDSKEDVVESGDISTLNSLIEQGGPRKVTHDYLNHTMEFSWSGRDYALKAEEHVVNLPNDEHEGQPVEQPLAICDTRIVLQKGIPRELLASKPLTLGYVFLLARMMEDRLEENRSTTTIAKPNDLVEKLPMELQLKKNVMGGLEIKDLKKMMIDLNPTLHDLQEVKTKCALKIDDEEFKKVKSEVTRKIRKLAKVYDAWLPSWLASRSNPDFNSNTTIDAADPQIVIKKTMISIRAYDAIMFITIKNMDRQKWNPNALTTWVMARGDNVSRREMRISFINPATNVEKRGMYEWFNALKVDMKSSEGGEVKKINDITVFMRMTLNRSNLGVTSEDGEEK